MTPRQDKKILKEHNSDLRYTVLHNTYRSNEKFSSKGSKYSGTKTMPTAKTARGDRSKSPLGGSFKPGSTKPSVDSDLPRTKFVAKRRPIADNVEEYSGFLNLVGDTPGIRAKRMNAGTLISTLEDIYTARFIKDTSYFKAQLKKGSGDEISDKSFPEFIYQFYKKKLKSNKKNIQQASQDLVCSLEHHRKDILEADLFANFLAQKYDTRDLVFYLYTR